MSAGNPKPNISWITPTGEVTMGTEIEGGSVLQIRSSKREDNGTFTCMARNDFGITSKGFQVFIEGKYFLTLIKNKWQASAICFTLLTEHKLSPKLF